MSNEYLRGMGQGALFVENRRWHFHRGFPIFYHEQKEEEDLKVCDPLQTISFVKHETFLLFPLPLEPQPNVVFMND